MVFYEKEKIISRRTKMLRKERIKVILMCILISTVLIVLGGCMNPVTKSNDEATTVNTTSTNLQFRVGMIGDIWTYSLPSMAVIIRDTVELETFLAEHDLLTNVPKEKYIESFFKDGSLLFCSLVIDKHGKYKVEKVIKEDNAISIQISYEFLGPMDIVFPTTIVLLEVKKSDIADIDSLTFTTTKRVTIQE